MISILYSTKLEFAPKLSGLYPFFFRYLKFPNQFHLFFSIHVCLFTFLLTAHSLSLAPLIQITALLTSLFFLQSSPFTSFLNLECILLMDPSPILDFFPFQIFPPTKQSDIALILLFPGKTLTLHFLLFITHPIGNKVL